MHTDALLFEDLRPETADPKLWRLSESLMVGAMLGLLVYILPLLLFSDSGCGLYISGMRIPLFKPTFAFPIYECSLSESNCLALWKLLLPGPLADLPETALLDTLV